MPAQRTQPSSSSHSAQKNNKNASKERTKASPWSEEKTIELMTYKLRGKTARQISRICSVPQTSVARLLGMASSDPRESAAARNKNIQRIARITQLAKERMKEMWANDEDDERDERDQEDEGEHYAEDHATPSLSSSTSPTGSTFSSLYDSHFQGYSESLAATTTGSALRLTFDVIDAASFPFPDLFIESPPLQPVPQFGNHASFLYPPSPEATPKFPSFLPLIDSLNSGASTASSSSSSDQKHAYGKAPFFGYT